MFSIQDEYELDINVWGLKPLKCIGIKAVKFINTRVTPLGRLIVNYKSSLLYDH